MVKTFLDVQNIRQALTADTGTIIGDTYLARQYNKIISEMAAFATKPKYVATNLIAAQADYAFSLFTGFISAAQVLVNDEIAQYIRPERLAYYDDNHNIYTVIPTNIKLQPAPTAAATNGLKVYYNASLPVIIDAAVAGTALTDAEDRDWFVIAKGIEAFCIKRYLTYYTTNSEGIPDANLTELRKFALDLTNEYNQALKDYGEQAPNFATQPAEKGTIIN